MSITDDAPMGVTETETVDVTVAQDTSLAPVPIVLSHTNAKVNILHFQGSSRNMFMGLMEEFASRATDIQLPMDFTLVTFATGQHNIRRSPLIRQLVAAGVPFLNPVAEFDLAKWGRWSATFRPEIVAETLRQIKTRYTLILDGLDVAIQTFDNILTHFNTYDKAVLFGATKSRHPNVFVDSVPNRDERGDFQWLNAGTCMGETLRLREFYDKVVSLDLSLNEHDSEQFMIRSAFATSQDYVDFDWKSKVFQTFGKSEVAQAGNNTLRVT